MARRWADRDPLPPERRSRVLRWSFLAGCLFLGAYGCLMAAFLGEPPPRGRTLYLCLTPSLLVVGTILFLLGRRHSRERKGGS